jgi:GH24 family phage-related lysozyme (muramidase)
MTTANSKADAVVAPNKGMTMSPPARAKMRATEKAVLKYYNDMGKDKGNCTWGIGFYAHRGVCTADELQRKVSAPSVDIEYGKRVIEAERRVKLKVKIPLNQAQFDALVSFTYNTRNQVNQTVYDALNGGDFAAAADRMSKIIRVNVDGKAKLAPGLIARRAEESAPFRTSANSVIEANK